MAKLRIWRYFSVVMVVALILGLGAVAVPAAPAQADDGTWDIQTVDDIDVMSTSIALDSNGYPHISYTSGGLDSLYYAHWTGTAWEKEMVADVPAMVTSLALDSNDCPHIIYFTFGPHSLHYKYWTGTDWATKGEDPVYDGSVYDCSLALDSSDRPHISYSLGDSGYLQYIHWTGTRWVGGTVDDENITWNNSLVLDSNDRPHISYSTLDLNSLHYKYWTGTDWATKGEDPVAEGTVASSSIALDSSGYPHISYATDDLKDGSLHYIHWTGTRWVGGTIDEDAAVDTSLALDSNDRPHISYLVVDILFEFPPPTLTVTGTLKYAHWTGSAWDIQILDQETHTWGEVTKEEANESVGALIGGGKWSSIGLDGYDLPHISYGNLISGSGPLCLHYAHLIPPATATVDTATGTGTATFSTSAGGIAVLTAAASTPCGTPPPDLSFPHGFFSFAITGIPAGSTVTMTITFPSDMPADSQYWKCIDGQWIDATSILGSNDGDSVLMLTITDGGPFDADGQANGTIVDPGGPVLVLRIGPSLPSGPRGAPRNPANLSIQYMSINPKQVYANQTVTITTNVANTGGETGSLNVILKINDKVEQAKAVIVGPQGTQPVKFTVTEAQAGTYNVDIGGQKGSFTVLGAGGSAEGSSSSDRMIAILIVIAVLVVAVVLLVWMLISRPA